MTLQEMKYFAMRVERARDILERDSLKPLGLHVSVTDPLAAAIRECDKVLEALDRHLGAALREEERNRPKEMAAPPHA